MKAYYAARETHHKKAEAVMTVLIDRLVGLFAMLLFACLMMPPNLDLLRKHRRLAALCWLAVLMMSACGSVLSLSFWGGLSRTWSSARVWLRRLPKAELLERALDAARQFGREPMLLGKLLGISMVLNVCCVLQIMVLGWGLGLQIPPLALFVIVPVIVCVSALPITPSGLGLRENLYVLMLTVPELHVDATRALSLSLLAYAGSLFWSLVGGLVYLSRRDQDHLAEIAAPVAVRRGQWKIARHRYASSSHSAASRPAPEGRRLRGILGRRLCSRRAAWTRTGRLRRGHVGQPGRGPGFISAYHSCGQTIRGGACH